nr:ATP-binding cassette domain-containing protein [Propylenella binzhouense]
MALAGIDLDVRPGEVLGLIGPNGSGKSTLLSVIAGRQRPSAGAIRLDGRDVAGRDSVRLCRAGIACTFQLVRLPDTLSARDNVAVAAMYGRRRLGIERARHLADELLERVAFGADRHALPAALTYSDQKRVELARALATEPRILLLDEWLAGLTPTELADALDLVAGLRRDHALTLVVVEHVMAAIRTLCERVAVLDAGRLIAEGSVEACLSDPEVVRVYLGDEDA